VRLLAPRFLPAPTGLSSMLLSVPLSLIVGCLFNAIQRNDLGAQICYRLLQDGSFRQQTFDQSLKVII
jgi:hypothetical protein